LLFSEAAGLDDFKSGGSIAAADAEDDEEREEDKFCC
jgi:hypothetical protein